MITDHMARAATRLSDEELIRCLEASERCARCLTRSRRDLARMRAQCLRCELDRRRAGIRSLNRTP